MSTGLFFTDLQPYMANAKRMKFAKSLRHEIMLKGINPDDLDKNEYVHQLSSSTSYLSA